MRARRRRRAQINWAIDYDNAPARAAIEAATGAENGVGGWGKVGTGVRNGGSGRGFGTGVRDWAGLGGGGGGGARGGGVAWGGGGRMRKL